MKPSLDTLPGPWTADSAPPPPTTAAQVASRELEGMAGPWSAAPSPSLSSRDSSYTARAAKVEEQEHDLAQKLVLDGLKAIYKSVLEPIEQAVS